MIDLLPVNKLRIASIGTDIAFVRYTAYVKKLTLLVSTFDLKLIL